MARPRLRRGRPGRRRRPVDWTAYDPSYAGLYLVQWGSPSFGEPEYVGIPLPPVTLSAATNSLGTGSFSSGVQQPERTAVVIRGSITIVTFGRLSATSINELMLGRLRISKWQMDPVSGTVGASPNNPIGYLHSAMGADESFLWEAVIPYATGAPASWTTEDEWETFPRLLHLPISVKVQRRMEPFENLYLHVLAPDSNQNNTFEWGLAIYLRTLTRTM